VWNLVHSDPHVRPLLDMGRPAFELKVGQGSAVGRYHVGALSTEDMWPHEKP
jgi:hypothetical protein